MRKFRLLLSLTFTLILSGTSLVSVPSDVEAQSTKSKWSGYCFGEIYFFQSGQKWCPSGKSGSGGCYYGEPGLGKNCYQGLICSDLRDHKMGVYLGKDGTPICSRQENVYNEGHSTTPQSCKDHPGVLGDTWCPAGKNGTGACMNPSDMGLPGEGEVCHQGLVCKGYQKVCLSNHARPHCYNPKTQDCKKGFVCKKEKHSTSPCLPGKNGPGGCRREGQICNAGARSMNFMVPSYCPPGKYSKGGFYNPKDKYCNNGLLCRIGDDDKNGMGSKEIAAYCRSDKFNPYGWRCIAGRDAHKYCTLRPLECSDGMANCPGNDRNCYSPKHHACFKGGIICNMNEKVCNLPNRKPFCYDPAHSPCDKNTPYCKAGKYGDGGPYDIKTQSCGNGLICKINESACKKRGKKAYCHDPRNTRCGYQKPLDYNKLPTPERSDAPPKEYNTEQDINDLLRSP